MLYFGLVVGAILGICISIILLALAKEFAIKAEFGKEKIIVNQVDQKKALSFLAILPTRKKDKLLSNIGR